MIALAVALAGLGEVEHSAALGCAAGEDSDEANSGMVRIAGFAVERSRRCHSGVDLVVVCKEVLVSRTTVARIPVRSPCLFHSAGDRVC